MCVLVFLQILTMIIVLATGEVNPEELEEFCTSKKIVVITGSPRKDGNSFAMTDAFIKSAEAKGHTVTRFDAAMKKVGGCHACETCFKTGKACSFDAEVENGRRGIDSRRAECRRH